MARTAPVPNIPAIPGMNPGVFVMGGGGAGGGGSGKGGKGSGQGQGAGGNGGGEDAEGGGAGAGSCGTGANASGCPNQHPGSSGGQISKGDPVDVVTGRVFTIPEIDLELPGPLPLQIERSYSSSARHRDVGLGFGWTWSLAWQLYEGRRAIRVRTYDGIEHDFGKIDGGSATLGLHGWLLHREGNGFRLDFPDGRRLLFEEQSPEPRIWLLTAIEDRLQNRIALRYERGLLVGVVDAVGREVRIRRNPEGRVASLSVVADGGRVLDCVRYAYEAGDLTHVANADGHTTRFTYLEDHLLGSQTDANSLTFYFVYDSSDRCTETWGAYPNGEDISLAPDVPPCLVDGTPAKGVFHTRLVYGEDGYSEAADSVSLQRYFGNAQGLVTKAVSPLGVFSRTFDERGFVTSFTDSLGATTQWKRDIFGRETMIIDPLGNQIFIERDADGEIVEIVGALGESTKLTRGDHTLSWTDPLGATTTVRFDNRGQPIAALWPDGRMIEMKRDRHGNVVERKDELGAVTRAAYDIFGRCIEIHDARGGHTTFRYSASGRVLARVDGDGSEVTYGYDGVGNVTRVTNADGHSTHLYYGGFRKLARIEKPSGEVVHLHYNREGWLTSVTNGRGQTHRIQRDDAGLAVREETFDGRVLRYGYDAMARRIWSENGLGEKTEYERDIAGKLIATVYPDGSEERLTRDAHGDIVEAVNDAGRFTFERNAMGWIVREEQTVAGETVSVSTTYRNTGEIAARATSLGHRAEWRYFYDRGRVELLLDGSLHATSVIDVIGNEVERILEGGGRVFTRYDRYGRVERRHVFAKGAQPSAGQPDWIGGMPAGALYGDEFRYTPAGLLAEVKSTNGIDQYRYDPGGRLDAWLRDGAPVVEQSYDKNGNVYRQELARVLQEYGRGDRLERWGDHRYLWDGDGRLVEKQRAVDGATEVTRYHWSGAGMLARVDLPDGRMVSFDYDPFARRVRKRVLRREASGTLAVLSTTRYVWDGKTVVHEIHHDGELEQRQRTYVFEHGWTVPFAHGDRDESGVVHWWHYLNDDSGAPQALVAPDGEVGCYVERSIWRHRLRSGRRATDTPLRFRGQYADEETGLSYNRHRYFDPEVGRYISADPIGIEGGMNLFVYANNCPTSAVDVEGLMFSVIKDRDGRVVAKGENLAEGGGVGTPNPAVPGRSSCAETTALTNMANQMGPGTTKEDVAKKFNEDGYTIETYEGNEADYNRGVRIPANPCPACKQMFNEDIGINNEQVMGHAPRRKNKPKPWDGHSTYEPTPKGMMRDARRRR